MTGRRRDETTDTEQGRRAGNHQAWEDNDTRGAIKAKGREALTQRAAGSRTPQVRHQRNNRREV